jgi:DNA-binding NtrC family response regulator
MNPSDRASILVVDDEEGVRSFLADALSAAGQGVAQVADGEGALALIASRAFHVALTDLRMPGMDGMALLPTVATVLLLGESGVGKEIAARAIHRWTGTFRGDLYHRLSVFPVQLPPLRERREDIGPLADHLIRRIGVSLGRPELTLTDGARAALATASWSGNVRELANVLERSAILADASAIDADDLALLPQIDAVGGAAAPGAGTARDTDDVPTTITDIERQAIERALAATGGSRRQTAARLGMPLRTLYDKLKRHGVS